MKDILIISGSRNPEGYTARAVQAFAEGVARTPAKSDIVFLPELKIERCRQCENNGWGDCRSQGTCVIGDDLADTADRIRETEAVVFANPVYYGDLSESLRAFLDRLRRISNHESGRDGIAGKKAIGICVAGGGGGGSYLCAVQMEKVLNNIGFDILDLIPVRRQTFEMKLEVCRTAGKWFAEMTI